MNALTTQEQDNVRTALRFLRFRCGGWRPLAKVLRFKRETLAHANGKKTVSANLAIRVARFVGIPIDDVLTGKYPPAGTCPHCGYRPADGDAQADATQR